MNTDPDIVSGPVTVGVRSALPIDGVHFLLGNDFAGGRIVPGPVATDKPHIEEVIDRILKEIPHLYPSCAVTRAMTHMAGAFFSLTLILPFFNIVFFCGKCRARSAHTYLQSYIAPYCLLFHH